MTPLGLMAGVGLTAVVGAASGAIWWFASRFCRAAEQVHCKVLAADLPAAQPPVESDPSAVFSPPPFAFEIPVQAPLESLELLQFPGSQPRDATEKEELSDEEIDALPPELPIAAKRGRGRPAISSVRV